MAAKKGFEDKLNELNSILNEMENNKELTLDKSLDLYEKGIKLIRECTKSLEEAEQKLTVINKEFDLKEEQ